jgi:EAL domain-containing protein (putative c-di-GMP-specific phosphodiesterase class I)
MRRVVGLLEDGFGQRGNLAHLGVAHYRHGQSADLVRQQADLALRAALARGDNAVAVQESATADPDPDTDWAALLQRALADGGLHLQEFPVVHADGRLLHEEVALRLRHPGTGEVLAAGRFMPWATRLGLSAALDLEATRQALARIRGTGRPVAINLAIESAASTAFLAELAATLEAAPELSARLWFEVGEHGLEGELRVLRELAATLRPFGCHLGIDHFGRHLSSLPHLHELGLDYLKIDSGLVAGVDAHPGNQALVQAIASVAGALGLLTIAERVRTAAERETLAGLGVSGLTGPIVGE